MTIVKVKASFGNYNSQRNVTSVDVVNIIEFPEKIILTESFRKYGYYHIYGESYYIDLDHKSIDFVSNTGTELSNWVHQIKSILRDKKIESLDSQM